MAGLALGRKKQNGLPVFMLNPFETPPLKTRKY